MSSSDLEKEQIIEKLQQQVNKLLKKLIKKRQDINVIRRNYENVQDLFEKEKKK